MRKILSLLIFTAFYANAAKPSCKIPAFPKEWTIFEKKESDSSAEAMGAFTPDKRKALAAGFSYSCQVADNYTDIPGAQILGITEVEGLKNFEPAKILEQVVVTQGKNWKFAVWTAKPFKKTELNVHFIGMGNKTNVYVRGGITLEDFTTTELTKVIPTMLSTLQQLKIEGVEGISTPMKYSNRRITIGPKSIKF